MTTKFDQATTAVNELPARLQDLDKDPTLSDEDRANMRAVVIDSFTGLLGTVIDIALVINPRLINEHLDDRTAQALANDQASPTDYTFDH